MIKLVKRIWNDAVWSKVIAAAIVATVITYATYLLNWWDNIWTATKAGFSFLVATSPIWNGAIALVITLFLLQTAVLIRIFQVLRAEEKPDWRDYARDTFYGGDFRWRFTGSGGDLTELHCCCPECQYQVFAHGG